VLSEEEKKFLVYWEVHRSNEKRTMKQWLIGLPTGLLFGIPILVNFFSGWYKRANMDLKGQLSSHDFNPLVLFIAILLIISFMAIFSKRHRWEMNEQRYRELKARDED
jgi:integral membrane sensor domain MASE1